MTKCNMCLAIYQVAIQKRPKFSMSLTPKELILVSYDRNWLCLKYNNRKAVRSVRKENCAVLSDRVVEVLLFFTRVIRKF